MATPGGDKQDVYTHGHQAAVVNQHARRTAEECARFCRGVIEPHHGILDVGCGPGSITVGLARWVTDGHVTAIEPGGDILDTARAAVTEAGVGNVDGRRVGAILSGIVAANRRAGII